MDVLALFNFAKFLSEIAFVAGAIKLIIINFITSENSGRFQWTNFSLMKWSLRTQVSQ